MRPAEDGDMVAMPLLHHDQRAVEDSPWWKPSPLRKLGASFWVFGLINEVLYVLILSAALDLVPASTPKGIIAFCNIAPSVMTKILWPYFSRGRIQYARRITACCSLSFLGMVVVASFESVAMRLLGIGLASCSSGFGELTFLQLSTTYRPSSVGGASIGSFASGTGAAGLVGASFWWILRGLGVRTGIGLSSIFPFVLPMVYFGLLPDPGTVAASVADHKYVRESLPESPTVSYAPIPIADTPAEEDDAPEDMSEDARPSSRSVALSKKDKWRLARPLIMRFMLPLFCVYLFEYIINQGVAPTLLYPVPTPEMHPVFSHIIYSIRDYYPLWQLIYQSTGFLSRSSISFGFSPLPSRLISLPAVVQALILLTLTLESALGLFGDDTAGYNIGIVFALITIEGICGGLAYVNVFYHANQDRAPPQGDDDEAAEFAKQAHEFKIGSIGLADSSGVLFASLLAMPTEVGLCKAQVSRGRTLCRGV